MSYKVLLVDPDPARAERIQGPLLDLGCSVVLAPEALDALAQFESQRPDLVVIETAAENRQGLELCQSLKETPRGRSTPIVVAVECEPGHSLRAQALDRYGCDAYLENPVADSVLVDACRRLLAEHDPGTHRRTDTALRLDDLAPGERIVDEDSLADALGALEQIPEPAAAAGLGSDAVSFETPDDSESPDWTCDALGETLDELSRAADELNDRITATEDRPHVPNVPMAEPGIEALDSLKRSVDELSCAIGDPGESAPASPRIEVEGDRGEDIDDALATVLTPLPPKPPKAARGTARVTHNLGLAQGPPSSATPTQPTIRRLDRHGASQPAEPREAPAEIRQSAILSESGSSSEFDTVVSAARPRPRAASLLVAALALMLASAGAWLLLSQKGPRSAEPVTTEAARIARAAVPPPLPEAVIELAPTVDPSANEASSVSAESVTLPPAVTEPSAPPTVASEPVSRPSARVVAKPVKSVTPGDVPTQTSAEPSRTIVRIGAGGPVGGQVQRPTLPPPPSVGGRVTIASAAASPTGTQTEAALPAIPEPAPDSTPTAIASNTERAESPQPLELPEIPAFEAPVALRRVHPTLPPRTLAPGESATVGLRVLVNESGRVVRVLVESGIPGSEIEAAAIDAVLGWEYRPASEHGHAIRAWTTETFVFEAPPSK